MEDIESFFNSIKNIKYGWQDKRGNFHASLKDGNFKKDYKMQKTDDILKNNYAICWEMCELQRKFFKEKHLKVKNIFVMLKNSHGECHTFTVFYLNNYWYWFEASWEKQKGIHQFNSLAEILDFYRDNFSDFAKKGYDKKNLVFYEYAKPLFRYNCNWFYYHCCLGKKI